MLPKQLQDIDLAVSRELNCPPFCPEKQLIFAILFRSIVDATTTACVSKESVRSAKKWILSDDREPFSFHWIADYLKINDSLKKKLRHFCGR